MNKTIATTTQATAAAAATSAPTAPRCAAGAPLSASWLVLALGAAIAASGCASLPAAQMALPAPLATAAYEPVKGIGIGRKGDFEVGRERGSFSRGRDRLEIFGVLNFDRSPVRYALTRADGTLVEASCRGRQNNVTLGVLTGNAKPFTYECEWRGEPQGKVASMTVAAPSWIPGTRATRNGSFTQGNVTLEIASVHNVQGSPLPLEAPIGYVMSHQGKPVAAIELNGTTPRLWRPAAGDALAEPVTLAAMALALLWDPANATP